MHRLIQMRPNSVLSSTRHHFRLVAQRLHPVCRRDRLLLKHRVCDGDALVPAAKLLKDASALGKQAVGEGADVVYVAVGHGLVVDLLTLFVAEIAAIPPVRIREDPSDLILVAAGQRSSSPTTVEVVVDDSFGSIDEVVVAFGSIDVVVVAFGSIDGLECSRSSGGSVKSPVSTPSSAVDMNFPQICAGKEPPVTFRPCTSVMGWLWPSG